MLTYSDLTKSQKRWVDNMIVIMPQFANGGNITLKECAASYDILRGMRDTGIGKIGYPNWLYNKNKLARGLYFFPAPGAEPAEFVKQASTQRLAKRLDSKDAFKVESKEDEDFLAELLEAGIDIKVAPQTVSPL